MATRYDQLLLWMRKRYITFAALGRQLGISDVYARRLCRDQFIPAKYHTQMIALGFPAEMLPEISKGRRGRVYPDPIFPGLHSTTETEDKP